jgi:Leucine rich repeat
MGFRDSENLKTMAKLMELDLSQTKIADAGLANLAGCVKLETLRLNDSSISDAGLPHLEGLVNLRMLDLARTRVSAAGMNKLQRVLRKTKIYRNYRISLRRQEMPPQTVADGTIGASQHHDS